MNLKEKTEKKEILWRSCNGVKLSKRNKDVCTRFRWVRNMNILTGSYKRAFDHEKMHGAFKFNYY